MRPLLVFFVFIIDVWAIVEVLGSRARRPAKLGWLTLIVLVPLVGFGVWLLFGPRRTTANAPSRGL